MKKGDLETMRGFTIIEVALVIAIAGLIFLMVFVALPGLRASQRDAERREDMTSFLETVKKYQTNNRGALPNGTGIAEHDKPGTSSRNSWQDLYNDYLSDDFYDPNGEYYKLIVMECGAQADVECVGTVTSGTNELNNLYGSLFPNNYKMLVVRQASCRDDRAVGTSNPRKIAVLYKLEGAGIYCANT